MRSVVQSPPGVQAGPSELSDVAVPGRVTPVGGTPRDRRWRPGTAAPDPTLPHPPSEVGGPAVSGPARPATSLRTTTTEPEDQSLSAEVAPGGARAGPLAGRPSGCRAAPCRVRAEPGVARLSGRAVASGPDMGEGRCA